MEPTNCSGPQLNKRPPYFKVLREIWPQCLNVFFIFFVTLAIFPAVQANVKSTGSLGWLTDKYFSPVTCFLVFNSFAMIGNVFPNWITWPGPDKLWIPVFARLAFIPFFLFCNYNPATRTWPVYFGNDWFYVIGGMFLGLTSGYYSSLAMMYAPRTVSDPDHAPIAGMMAAFFLILGIFLGVNFSLVLSSIIEMDFLWYLWYNHTFDTLVSKTYPFTHRSSMLAIVNVIERAFMLNRQSTGLKSQVDKLCRVTPLYSVTLSSSLSSQMWLFEVVGTCQIGLL